MHPSGFIDLHCHWVADIDDGVRAPAAGVALLRGLQEIGFSVVIATPHMRPGMFDNDRASLSRAFDAMRVPLEQARAAGAAPGGAPGERALLRRRRLRAHPQGRRAPLPVVCPATASRAPLTVAWPGAPDAKARRPRRVRARALPASRAQPLLRPPPRWLRPRSWPIPSATRRCGRIRQRSSPSSKPARISCSTFARSWESMGAQRRKRRRSSSRTAPTRRRARTRTGRRTWTS